MVALRTRTPHYQFFKVSSNFSILSSNISILILQFFNIFRCSKTRKDVLKQEGCSKIVSKTISWQLCSKKCAKVGSHIAHPKTSHTHAHPAHFSKWILHAHAHVRPHIARVRAHMHLRNSYLADGINQSLIYRKVESPS